MKPTIEQSEPLPEASGEGFCSPLGEAGQVLQAFVSRTGLGTRHHRGQVLAELASHAVAEAASGREATPLTAAYLKQVVAPGSGKDPSAWMSPIWSALVAEEMGWQSGLNDVAREMGCRHVARLEKTDGSPALYAIKAAPVAQVVNADPEGDLAPIPERGVRYTAESTTESAPWMKWCFRAGTIAWSPVTRSVIAGAFLVGLGLVLLLFVLAQMRARAPASAVTFGDLWLLVMLATAGYGLLRTGKYIEDLVDLRIVMAPSFLSRFEDSGVTLEVRARQDVDGTDHLVLARYSAVCPRCSGSVHPTDGGAAYPGRLVGRCQRSPREHAYSFDHALRVGSPLS